MKRLLILLLLPFFLIGCSSKTLDEEMAQVARNRILNGEAECILLSQNQMFIERGRGVSPLLTIYDTHRTEMEGGRIVDKVIGRATAAIAICGKVKHVHAELMSDGAIAFLEAHNITATYTKRVPLILNRKRDGRCPMELAVEGIDDPEQAVEAIRQKLKLLRQQTLPGVQS